MRDDDTPTISVEDSASDCDRELDAYMSKRIKALHQNPSVLRKLFSEYPTGDVPGAKAAQRENQTPQRVSPRSFPLTPSL